MYHTDDRNHPDKLNTCIAALFNGLLTGVPETLNEHASLVRLVDMLDFSRVGFDKQIALTAKKSVDIQSQWNLVKLGEICQINPSKSEIKNVNDKTIVSFVEMASVSESGLILQKIDKPLGELKKGSYTYFSENDIILAKITPCMENGKCAIAKELTNGLGMGSSEFHVIRAKNKILAEFVFIFLNTATIRKSAEQNMTGSSGHRRSPESFYHDLKIPLPPIEIQQQIVTECEAVDQTVTAAQAKIETANKQMADKINDMLASGHSLKALQEICEIKRGRFTHRPRNEPRFFGGDYPFIQTGDVVRAVASKVTYTQTLNEDGLSVSKLFQPPVVLVTIAANIGDTAVLDYPACFTDSVVGLTPKEGINARFLELMMRTHKKHLNDTAPQMAQKNINVEILKPVKIPVPPLADQQRLVADIEALERTIAAAQSLIDQAPAKKQAIMQNYL